MNILDQSEVNIRYYHLHDLGAPGRGAEHGAPGGGGVVRRHVLLTRDHNPPRY